MLAAVVAAGLPEAAKADSMFDVEHARSMARAGAPISEYDAELLERHGATSGTPGWSDRSYRDGGYSEYDDRRMRRHHGRASHRRLSRE